MRRSIVASAHRIVGSSVDNDDVLAVVAAGHTVLHKVQEVRVVLGVGVAEHVEHQRVCLRPRCTS